MQQPNTPSALICSDNQDPQNYAGTLNSKPEQLRIAVGADVHLESFNLCAKLLPGFGPQAIQLNNGIVSEARTRPSADDIVKFIENAKELICTKLGYAPAFSVDVAYEAGCLGYSLYKSLVLCDNGHTTDLDNTVLTVFVNLAPGVVIICDGESGFGRATNCCVATAD